jgi:transcriptional regulator with XRE-family HTH domain
MLGKRLKKARKAAGLSRPELAGAAGVGVHIVRDLEDGRAKTTSYENVILLARALDIDPGDLCSVP